MSDARLTDERLRSFLDTNQPARERMCLALLGLVPCFSNLQPVRPMGGPDGGKDIEGLWNNRLFYAGIGFRNHACDSPDDKKWVNAKFKSDIDSAKQKNPEIDQFIFLTNVDLTPGEREELIQYAYKEHFQKIDIYYRERLRVLLDNNPAGYPIRLQYLNIEMSGEEQVSFFNQFGNEIQEVINSKFEDIDKRLNRVEFLADCTKKLNCLYLVITLKKECSLEELTNGFFVMHLVDLRTQDDKGHPGVIVALRVSRGGVWNDAGKETPFIQIKNYAFLLPLKEKIVETARMGNVINYKNEMVMDGPSFSFSNPSFSLFQLDSLAKIYKKGNILSISDLENCFVYFRSSNELIDKILTITLIADEYVIFSVPIEQCKTQVNNNISELPEELLGDNVIESFQMVSHPALNRLSFSTYTPQKI